MASCSFRTGFLKYGGGVGDTLDFFAEDVEAIDWSYVVKMFPGIGAHPDAGLWRPFFDPVIELAGEKRVGQTRLELLQAHDEDLDGDDYVLGIVEFLDGPVEMVEVVFGFGREVMGEAGDDDVGELFDMAAGIDGVEVALGRTSLQRTEDGVAVGAS